jgi:segregation and condensation protein A
MPPLERPEPATRATFVADGYRQGRHPVEYRVDLDVYQGPLDLLLYLIKRDELDIYDIPISRITDSYVAYVNMLKAAKGGGLDINVAGEFLVMAATLMEIKSAMLLPRHDPAADTAAVGEESAAAALADPRYELVQKLLEYKRLKDSAALLEARRIEHAQRFVRQPADREKPNDEPPPIDLDEVQIWDLLDAFGRLMREVGARGPGFEQITFDDVPVELHAADIEDRLKRDGPLTFRVLLIGRPNRSEMIGMFLALLELVRQRRIILRAPGASSPSSGIAGESLRGAGQSEPGPHSGHVDDAMEIELALAPPELRAAADAEAGTDADTATPLHLAQTSEAVLPKEE